MVKRKTRERLACPRLRDSTSGAGERDFSRQRLFQDSVRLIFA